jgi:hypothetical protein
MRISIAAVITLVLSTLATPNATAANDMTGSWTIERADDAPWSNDKDAIPYRKAVPAYVGKHVVFQAKRIKGPSLLACRGPHYEMKEYGADMLFQGGLGEFERAGGKKAEDVATAMGFKTRPIRTLQTGCEHAFDFHMSDKDHAAFALDNMIYWLVRDRK